MNVALAIILENKKVLIGKIKSEKISDYGGLEYAFLSESIQNVENIEQELIRDVKRQTDLDVKVIQKIGERVHPLTKNHTYYFHCDKISEQNINVGVGIDSEYFVWVDINEIDDYMPTLFDGVKIYLKERLA